MTDPRTSLLLLGATSCASISALEPERRNQAAALLADLATITASPRIAVALAELAFSLHPRLFPAALIAARLYAEPPLGIFGRSVQLLTAPLGPGSDASNADVGPFLDRCERALRERLTPLVDDVDRVVELGPAAPAQCLAGIGQVLAEVLKINLSTSATIADVAACDAPSRTFVGVVARAVAVVQAFRALEISDLELAAALSPDDDTSAWTAVDRHAASGAPGALNLRLGAWSSRSYTAGLAGSSGSPARLLTSAIAEQRWTAVSVHDCSPALLADLAAQFGPGARETGLLQGWRFLATTGGAIAYDAGVWGVAVASGRQLSLELRASHGTAAGVSQDGCDGDGKEGVAAAASDAGFTEDAPVAASAPLFAAAAGARSQAVGLSLSTRSIDSQARVAVPRPASSTALSANKANKGRRLTATSSGGPLSSAGTSATDHASASKAAGRAATGLSGATAEGLRQRPQQQRRPLTATPRSIPSPAAASVAAPAIASTQTRRSLGGVSVATSQRRSTAAAAAPLPALPLQTTPRAPPPPQRAVQRGRGTTPRTAATGGGSRPSSAGSTMSSFSRRTGGGGRRGASPPSTPRSCSPYVAAGLLVSQAAAARELPPHASGGGEGEGGGGGATQPPAPTLYRASPGGQYYQALVRSGYVEGLARAAAAAEAAAAAAAKAAVAAAAAAPLHRARSSSRSVAGNGGGLGRGRSESEEGGRTRAESMDAGARDGGQGAYEYEV